MGQCESASHLFFLTAGCISLIIVYYYNIVKYYNHIKVNNKKVRILFTIISFTFFLSFSLFTQAQENRVAKEKVIQWLKIYLEPQDESFQYAPPYTKFFSLQKKGIDPVLFSRELISDIQFSEFWNEALGLYVAGQHRKNKHVELSKDLIQWIERDESLNSSNIICFKTMCINSLKQMIGPNFSQNKDLKKVILVFADKFFKNGAITKPEFWHQKYGLVQISSKERDALSKEETEQLSWAMTKARTCVKFASYIYNLTSDKRFQKIVEESMLSEYPQIKTTAKFCLSSKSISHWSAGEYELFAKNGIVQ
jgi:hypothetical protein